VDGRRTRPALGLSARRDLSLRHLRQLHQSLDLISRAFIMPVPLPLQPAGINLPPPPQDPPTVDDVVAAKDFQSQVDVAVGQPHLLLT